MLTFRKSYVLKDRLKIPNLKNREKKGKKRKKMRKKLRKNNNEVPGTGG